MNNDVLLGLLFLGALLVGYLLPAVIACLRGHHNSAAISVFTVLLGWTFLGWVIALVWSLTAVDERRS